MRFLHVSDLHFGKIIHGVSLLENGDQPVWTDRFLDLARQTAPDAVLIAGDVYDRSSPSEGAVRLLDRLLTGLVEADIPVLLVAGNHDSGQRLAFASSLLAREKLHIAGVLPETGQIERVILRDEYGPVNFWLLPYVFPAMVARRLGDETIRDYDGAMRRLLAEQPIDLRERNVLVAHQNVTSGGAEAERGGSEAMVGGVGQIDSGVFDCFDYVALGHIHAAGSVGREAVRYAGSPLCYHFNETRQPPKGPILVELGPKGEEPSFTRCDVPPLHPMRELTGPYEALRDGELSRTGGGEYLRIVLTDRRVTPEISSFFHELYRARGSELMELCSTWQPFAAEIGAPASGRENKSVEGLFSDFYSERCGGLDLQERDRALLSFAGELTRHAEPGEAPDEAACERLLRFLLEQEGEV